MTLVLTILSKLEVVAGYYAFSLPAAFCPDYKRHGVFGENYYSYKFDY